MNRAQVFLASNLTADESRAPLQFSLQLYEDNECCRRTPEQALMQKD
jgi:hypothetical protein